MGDGPGLPRRVPAGAPGGGAVHLRPRAAQRGAGGQFQPRRQHPALPSVRVPGVRQRDPRQRPHGGVLLRRDPAPAGGGGARRGPQAHPREL